MAEVERFPRQMESGFAMDKGVGEKKAPEKKFHMPPPHVLTPSQKFITVVELVFVGWLIYVVVKTIINNIVYLSHVL